METIYAVAIDGPAGAGKSSLARMVAGKLGILYVDTGAIYRTVGYHAFLRGEDPKNADAIAAMLPETTIEIAYGEDGGQRMYLNGTDVTDPIRQQDMAMYASCVSAIPAVRDFLIERQRSLARQHSVVMDGRDIGTVVLPEATVKIFLTAELEERARRRFKEFMERGIQTDFTRLLEEMRQRDYNDTHRTVAPLKVAEDAIIVDTTHLNFQESCDKMIAIIKERVGL